MTNRKKRQRDLRPWIGPATLLLRLLIDIVGRLMN